MGTLGKEAVNLFIISSIGLGGCEVQGYGKAECCDVCLWLNNG